MSLVNDAYAIEQESLDYAALYVNGTLKQTATLPLPLDAPFVRNFLGRGRLCQGHSGLIAEVLLYARALSSTEHTQVRSYLEAKWKLVPD